MPLGTLDRTPPPFFRQGPSALSKLVFFSALALFLMVADTRFKITQPLRAAVATVLYPVQWLLMQPVLLCAGRRRTMSAALQDGPADRRRGAPEAGAAGRSAPTRSSS